MLQELKEILGIIKDLPHMVMWVLAGLLFYKVTIVGSIYGVIKLAIEKIYLVLTKEKTVKFEYTLGGLPVNENVDAAIVQFLREVKKDSGSYGGYFNITDLQHLRDCYDIGLAQRKQKKTLTSI